MLTTVEKVIFLKQVSFFKEMTITQLRTLANISEEINYEKGQKILIEGEFGDALHVVISGKVAIQRQERSTITRLITLRSRDYFAEMSIFDNQAHDADAIALEYTTLLLVRQRPLVALIKHQPELSLSLLKILSQRLRQANSLIALKSGSKPKALVELYDKGSIHKLGEWNS